MIQQPNPIPESQTCSQSELMTYPRNSTKSLCRQKDTNVPRPLLSSPKQNEKPRSGLNRMTTRSHQAAMALGVRLDPSGASVASL